MTIKLRDVIKYYLPNQNRALAALERLLGDEGLSEDQEWVKAWREPAPLTAFNNTWEGIEAAARVAGAKFPEVVAAQWALESAFGTALSGKNNFFGIKGTPGTVKTTWEDYGNGPVTIKATFKDFAITTALRPCSAVVDYKAIALIFYLLKKEGYATDPIYPQKLIRLMEQYD
jgi:hypothetical protein